MSLGTLETKEDINRVFNEYHYGYTDTLNHINDFLSYLVNNYKIRTTAFYDFLGLVPPTNEDDHVKID